MGRGLHVEDHGLSRPIFGLSFRPTYGVVLGVGHEHAAGVDLEHLIHGSPEPLPKDLVQEG
jgi:hypothetical protein